MRPEACGILVPRPGIKPTPPALEGGVLTTGPPGESCQWHSEGAGGAASQERGCQCWLCFPILLAPPSLTEKDSVCQEGLWHSGGLYDYLGDSLAAAQLNFHGDSGSATSHFRHRSSLSLPLTHTGHVCPSSSPLHPSSPFCFCSFVEVWSSHRVLHLLKFGHVQTPVALSPWPRGWTPLCLPELLCRSLCYRFPVVTTLNMRSSHLENLEVHRPCCHLSRTAGLGHVRPAWPLMADSPAPLTSTLGSSLGV